MLATRPSGGGEVEDFGEGAALVAPLAELAGIPGAAELLDVVTLEDEEDVGGVVRAAEDSEARDAVPGQGGRVLVHHAAPIRIARHLVAGGNVGHGALLSRVGRRGWMDWV